MIPVTLIGGYLGAGKTTLVNHLLRNAGGRRIAVLVNEFGALPIDADLIEAEGDDLIAIAGGCICCAFGDDLMGAMQDLSQRSPAPDHVVIEASGVALPASISLSIGLLEGFDLAGTVVLADAGSVQKMARDDYLGDTILRQLSDADLVVLTKVDLVRRNALDGLHAWLNKTASAAAVIEALQGQVKPDLVLGPQIVAKADMPPHASEPDYVTEALHCPDPLDIDVLCTALTKSGLLRAKGFVQISEGRSVLVQLVGQRIAVTDVVAPPRLGLVCIGIRDRMDLSGVKHIVATQCV